MNFFYFIQELCKSFGIIFYIFCRYIVFADLNSHVHFIYYLHCIQNKNKNIKKYQTGLLLHSYRLKSFFIFYRLASNVDVKVLCYIFFSSRFMFKFKYKYIHVKYTYIEIIFCIIIQL